jgi:hypothetical protein
MPKREHSPGVSDSSSVGSADFGRHHAIADGEANTVRDHVHLFNGLSTPSLLAQVAGICVRLQMLFAAVRLNPGYTEPGLEQERVFLEDIRDKLQLTLPDLTDAISTLLAVEFVLSDRYLSVLGEIDSLPARRVLRRRRS